MTDQDIEYRYELAKKVQKFIAFSETLSHLNNVNNDATPIQAAIYFRKFWWHKLENIENNIVLRDMIPCYKEQLFLAEKRFYKILDGESLSLIDFQGDTDNYFTKNYPEFPAAVFLMDTFYVYREMFDFSFFLVII